MNTLIRDQLAKTQDELNMTKANVDLADIENAMTSQAQVADLHQEIIKLQQANMALQSEVDTLLFRLGEHEKVSATQKELSIRKMQRDLQERS